LKYILNQEKKTQFCNVTAAPMLNGNESWVVMVKDWTGVQKAGMGFLRRVSGCSETE
jgi:hypothetical protein